MPTVAVKSALDEPIAIIEETGDSWDSNVLTWLRRWIVPLLVLAIVWEAISHLSGINPALFPPIEVVARTFWELLLNGVLAQNAAGTLGRMFFGWVIASAVGLVLGFVMARNRYVEDLFLPIIGILLPIPSIAWIPFFILWFGLSNTSVVALVIFSAVLPTTLTVWSGMRTINPVWIRAAHSLGITGFGLFRKVILPASLPTVMTGLRIGIAQAWRAVIAGEMLAGTALGLGVLIFNSRQFLRTDVMLASLLVIGPLGFLIEKVLFETIERKTIERWGMTGRA